MNTISKKILKNKTWLILGVVLLFWPSFSLAAYSSFSLGETIIIGEFVSDDNFQATTTPCVISISNPVGTEVVSEALMSVQANGWHFYSFTGADTLGVWPAIMSCGSVINGDLAKLDKTFIINNADVSSSSIATAVWNHENRTIASGTLAADIWGADNRTLSSFGTLVGDIWSTTTRRLSDNILGIGGELATRADIDEATSTIMTQIALNQASIAALNNVSATDVWNYSNRFLTDYATSSIAEAVWLRPERSLTTFGSLITDVWTNSDRSLTNYATSSVAEAVWANPNRTLSNFGSLVTDVWSNSNRVLTDYAVSSISDAIWTDSNRSLTDFGTLITDIWSNTNRSLTDYAETSLSAAVWANSNRSLTTFGSLVSDVWTNSDRSLTNYATSSVAQAVWSNPDRALTSFGTLSTDIWSNANRSLTDYALSSVSDAVWANSSRSLTDFGTLITDIWSNSNRSLTDYAVTSISDAVWLNSSRSLSTFGSLVSDVWTNSNRSLTDYATSSIASVVWSNANRSLSSAALSDGGWLATESSLNAATSTILLEVLENRSLLSALNNISATDVWSAANRSLTANVEIATSSQEAIWNTATSNLSNNGSIGKLLVDNLDAKVSTRGTSALTAADVWDAANRTLTDYSTSSIALAVWADSARTLTNYGNDITAADVWRVLSSSLTDVGSIGQQLSTNLDNPVSTRASFSGQQASWSAVMSNVDRVLAGKTYRAKIFITNYEATPTNPVSAPTVTLYDAERNAVVANVSMVNLAAGIYEYTYVVPTAAAQGLWETVIKSEISNGKIIETNDYWVVEGSPAQVIINSINNNQIPNIAANVTITNEGLSGYEYHYEWCVVSSVNNACGGSDDTYYASASKYINAGQDWNTNLTAQVPATGNYFFKLVVYYGTEQSGASRFFTAITGTTPPSGGGGGGGGGITPPPAPTTTPTSTPTTTPELKVCSGADFNHDKKVNSIDFSILLAFWKTDFPFKNACVDINSDKQVNSVDFSILMYQWSSKN